jgi:4-amino-4-deoxychorismate lyase
MFQLVESICLRNGKLQNMSFHNQRFNRTRKELFGMEEPANLEDLIQIPKYLKDMVYKCRIVYSELIYSIEFIPYITRKIKNLQLIRDDTISYSFKYLDREYIDALKTHASADDILIVKSGFITDTSFSNIVFFDGSQWLTPTTFLLNGTMRQYLLSVGKIQEDEIKESDLKRFIYARPINAMLDFDTTVWISIANIGF